MAEVSVTARVASTHPVEKYNGVRLSEGALCQMAAALNSGTVPMLFDHSALEPIQVRNVRAEVVRLEGGEHAVNATFDVDETDWQLVQDRFSNAGVPGGFSFTAAELQIPPSSGRPPLLVLSADAAAFSDADRARAWEILERTGPAQTNRLYQYSASELARVIVEMWPQLALGLGINLMSSSLYDAVKMLVCRDSEPTVVEIHRHQPDGSHTNAVVTTNDPEIVRVALESLAEEQDEAIIRFDADQRLWLPGHRI